MMPLISVGCRPSYFQWRGYLASPSKSRSRGEGRASGGDGCCVPRAGGHHPRQEDTAAVLGSAPGGGVPSASPPGSWPGGKHTKTVIR